MANLHRVACRAEMAAEGVVVVVGVRVAGVVVGVLVVAGVGSTGCHIEAARGHHASNAGRTVLEAQWLTCTKSRVGPKWLRITAIVRMRRLTA